MGACLHEYIFACWYLFMIEIIIAIVFILLTIFSRESIILKVLSHILITLFFINKGYPDWGLIVLALGITYEFGVMELKNLNEPLERKGQNKAFVFINFFLATGVMSFVVLTMTKYNMMVNVNKAGSIKLILVYLIMILIINSRRNRS